MKLRRRKALYKFPAHSEILEVFIEGNQRSNQMYSIILQLARPKDIANLPKVLGRPTYLVEHLDSIEFYPVPDKPYVVRIRYIPPIAEY